MASLTIQDLHLALGGNPILKGINLAAEHGELVVLVGPSGCGKSTLLRAIAGLTLPDSGQITIGDDDVTREPPRQRDLAMVFQSYALYPHLTVRENRRSDSGCANVELRFGFRSLFASRHDQLSIAQQLSGGQRQRVAMGRAIADAAPFSF